MVYSLVDRDLEIRLQLECIISNKKSELLRRKNITHRVLRSERSEKSALDLKLDIDELQELHALSTRSPIRNYLAYLICQLEKVRASSHFYTSNKKEERKWSDIVAGRNPQASTASTSVIHNIETVITSGPAYSRIGSQRMDTNGNIKSTSVKKGKMKLPIIKPRIVLVGDSHARGVAGEILHQSDHHIEPTGYVKPNAGISELISTARNVSGQLTKKDKLVMIAGTNDIDTHSHNLNLTSIVNLLQDTQNTNIILAEIPVRYDAGARSHISAEIESYNRKLQKVTKGFQHVSLVKGTSNRELFTKHGLHLNVKGKEIFTKELLKILTIKPKNQETAAIQMPWKEEPVTKNTPNGVIKDSPFVQGNHSLITLIPNDQEMNTTMCGHSGINSSINLSINKSEGLIQLTVPGTIPDQINITSSTTEQGKKTTDQGNTKETTDNYSIITSIVPNATARKEYTTLQPNTSLTASSPSNQENPMENKDTRRKPANRITSLFEANQGGTEYRNSNRCKKLPVTRSADFLW